MFVSLFHGLWGCGEKTSESFLDVLHNHLQSLKNRFNALDDHYQTFVPGFAPGFPSLKQPAHSLISRFVYFDKLLKVFVTIL